MRLCRKLAGLLLMWALGAPAAEPQPITISEIAPPRLDGALDDPAWQTAGQINQLYLGKTNASVNGTTVYFGRDKQWMYLGFKCVNSNMAHIVQTVFKHDDMYPNFYANESVEVYIKPEAAQDRYYWFVVSADNVTFEQRLETTPIRKQEVGWNTPWRTATKRLPDGWTAEIAIPLYALECDDLSGAAINLIRNFRKIELDRYGAKQGEKTVLFALAPDMPGRPSSHDFKYFSPLAGLGGFLPETPFAPQIVSAALDGVRQVDGTNYYALRVTLAPATPVTGAVDLAVIEGAGVKVRETLTQRLDLRGTMNLDLLVPAGVLRARPVQVVLRDADLGDLAAWAVADTSVLSVIREAYAARSYYTTETDAVICLEFGLPAEMLARSELVIEAAGRVVMKLNGLRQVMTAGIPVSDLAPGRNAVGLRVRLDGKDLAEGQVNLVRLEPRPGYETKVDLVRGVLLKDQKPFFPVGICGHCLQYQLGREGSTEDDADIFQYLAEDIKLNTIIRMNPRLNGATNTAVFMRLAGQYGLQVVDWSSPLFSPVGNWERLNSLWEEREPRVAADVKLLRDYPNLICYYNVDEPNLGNADEKIAVAEWFWRTVSEMDPYRPAFLLYSMNIPSGDIWTRWGEILGFDIYPRPFMPGLYGNPGLYTAYYACKLRERCRHDHKVMWFVPLANNLGSGRCPIGMNRAQMLCQAYTAIIYGARGLLYFTLNIVLGEEGWNGLRAVSAQVRELSPALLNGNVAQNIKYTPDDFNPQEQKFPMVNAEVFRYPDGDYLLLAVNIMAHAVETTFKVGGMQTAMRLFEVECQRDKDAEGQSGKGTKAQSKMELADGAFKEKIEPYGVRAYRLQLAPVAAAAAAGGLSQPGWDDRCSVPVELSLTMAPVEHEIADSVDITGIVRQLKTGKNHVANPCFERQFIPGVPDFYFAYLNMRDMFFGQKGKSGWYMDETAPWKGRPSLRMLSRPFGINYILGSAYPPESDKPLAMTFSFYARGENPAAALKVTIGGRQRRFNHIGQDWQRYHFTLDLKPGDGSNLGICPFSIAPEEGMVVWINGLQLEEGTTPTDFWDDSIPVGKETSGIDSDNLVRNGGAEDGTTDGWQGFGGFLRRGGGRLGGHAFCWRGQSCSIRSDWMAIDTNKTYELSGWFKAESGVFTGVIFGVVMADDQQRLIRRPNVFSVKGTGTELAVPCRAAERVLLVKDGSKWRPGRSFVAAFDAGENQLTFDISTPGIAEVRPAGAEWMIALEQPCGFDMPAGAPVVENSGGGNGIFFCVNAEIPAGWAEFKGVIGPRQWWPGAAYTQVLVTGASGFQI